MIYIDLICRKDNVVINKRTFVANSRVDAHTTSLFDAAVKTFEDQLQDLGCPFDPTRGPS